MLIIPTYLAPSRLHGLGVFTRGPVKAGSVVSRFMPPFDIEFPEELFRALTPAEQAYLRQFAYRSRFTQLFVLTGDPHRVMNHEETANLGMHPDCTACNVALRDIEPGEELTCDYRTLDADWKLKLPALCSS